MNIRYLAGRCGHALFSLVLILSMALFTAPMASAAVDDGNFKTTTDAVFAAGAAQDNAAGKGMIGAVGNTVSSLAGIITGPVLYIIMGLAIMISVFGFVSGKMVMAFSGIGAFVLAAVLKALFTMLFPVAAP